MDDQANEREQERDEAQKKIDMLYGQLRERDKDKVNCERVNSEVSKFGCVKANSYFVLYSQSFTTSLASLEDFIFFFFETTTVSTKHCLDFNVD